MRALRSAAALALCAVLLLAPGAGAVDLGVCFDVPLWEVMPPDTPGAFLQNCSTYVDYGWCVNGTVNDFKFHTDMTGGDPYRLSPDGDPWSYLDMTPHAKYGLDAFAACCACGAPVNDICTQCADRGGEWCERVVLRNIILLGHLGTNHAGPFLPAECASAYTCLNGIQASSQPRVGGDCPPVTEECFQALELVLAPPNGCNPDFPVQDICTPCADRGSSLCAQAKMMEIGRLSFTDGGTRPAVCDNAFACLDGQSIATTDAEAAVQPPDLTWFLPCSGSYSVECDQALFQSCNFTAPNITDDLDFDPPYARLRWSGYVGNSTRRPACLPACLSRCRCRCFRACVLSATCTRSTMLS